MLREANSDSVFFLVGISFEAEMLRCENSDSV